MDLTFTRRARGELKRGFFISLAALCLAIPLVLASCGGDDDGGSTTTTRPMNGYLLAQNPDGILECVGEDWNITESADGTVSAVSIVTTRRFEIAGYSAENDKSNTEILAVGYSTVDSDGGNRRNPGVVYLQKTSDDPVRFRGLWIGKHNRPRDGDGMVAVCPYVMVPDPDDEAVGPCPSDIDDMLGDLCYPINDNGFVNVASPVRKGEAVR